MSNRHGHIRFTNDTQDPPLSKESTNNGVVFTSSPSGPQPLTTAPSWGTSNSKPPVVNYDPFADESFAKSKGGKYRKTRQKRKRSMRRKSRKHRTKSRRNKYY
jgi:hypothetical protein